MLVRDLGEFELIAALEGAVRERNGALFERLRARGVSVRAGIGDDAAVWEYPAATVVSTTDTMVEGTHFDARTTGWDDLGWKAMASNLSDVASMGCEPTFALITLGLRGDIPVDGLQAMYAGMMDACERFGGALVGGDVVRSDTFFVTVALEGIAESGAEVMSRSAARTGELVAVTGDVGASAGGLRILLDPDAAASGADAAARRRLVNRHNRPTPRVSEGLALRGAGVRCAMDVSDGLTADLAKLCAASGAAAVARADAVPVDPSLRAAFPDEWLDMALGGGEDYELLICADARTMNAARERLGDGLTVFGEIEPRRAGEARVRVVGADGAPIEVASGGWEHF